MFENIGEISQNKYKMFDNQGKIKCFRNVLYRGLRDDLFLCPAIFWPAS